MDNNAIEDRIEIALAALEKHFGVSITLHDLRGTLRRPAGKILLQRRNIHRHPCCMVQRYDHPDWDARCYRDCFTNCKIEAAEQGRPYLKTCWKGLTEIVIPLLEEGLHLMTLFAGVFRTQDGESCSEFPISDKKYLNSYRALPLVDIDELRRLGEILSLVGAGILSTIDSNASVTDNENTRNAAIRRYLRLHAHEMITLADLARYLHLSPSRASHVVKEQTGLTFQDLLLEERMLRARQLLEFSPGSLEEVAEALGFANVSYFSRVFRRCHGLPPGEFRNRVRIKTT
jgi:AraC-like DNA-binding protein/ligand-binding sensor protein